MGLNETVLSVKQPHQNFESLIAPNDIVCGKYRILKHLGIPSGQSDIYLCEHKGTQYIAKLFKSSMVFDSSVIEIIKQIDSERVVQIIDDGVFKNRRFEVYPYFSKGDLSRVKKIDEEILREYVIPFINEALNDVHKFDIAHMDLKPSNIFVDASDSLFLGDFGICSVLADESIKVTSAKGTLGYRPPESYSEISIKSKQFDYYAFGMTIIHLWSGKSPYHGLSEMQIMAHTLDGKIPIPEEMPSDLKLLIKGLTAYDKRKRVGYSVVGDWCKGRDISNQVSDSVIAGHRQFNKLRDAYVFMTEELKDITDFSRAITRSEKHWDEAKNRLKLGLLEDFFSSLGHDEYAAVLIAMREENLDLALAKLVYETAPVKPMVWKECYFESVSALGAEILKWLPEHSTQINEMKDSGFLQFIFNEENQEEALEVLAKNEETTMDQLGFLLSENKQFNFVGGAFYTFNELVDHLLEKDIPMIDQVDKLMSDSYFLMWTESLKKQNPGVCYGA